MERKHAKMEGAQEIKEITSEKRRGRMDDATARKKGNRNDAAARMTRPRELETAQVTRRRGRRVRVEKQNAE